MGKRPPGPAGAFGTPAGQRRRGYGEAVGGGDGTVTGRMRLYATAHYFRLRRENFRAWQPSGLHRRCRPHCRARRWQGCISLRHNAVGPDDDIGNGSRDGGKKRMKKDLPTSCQAFCGGWNTHQEQADKCAPEGSAAENVGSFMAAHKADYRFHSNWVLRIVVLR